MGKTEKKESEKGGEKKPVDDCSKLRREVKELTETVQFLQADYENYCKRNAREKELVTERAKVEFAKELLPFLDSLDDALKNAGSESHGLELLHKQFMGIMQGLGLQAIECKGRAFDHTLHEVVMTGNEKGKRDGIVLEELQKGYKVNETVLRPAKVKVNKVNDEKGEENVSK